MTKVLIDLTATQPALKAKFHGGGEYAKMVFYKAVEMGYTGFDCVYDDRLFIEPSIICLCRQAQVKLIPIHSTNNLYEVVKNEQYDVFYSAMPYSLSNFNCPKTRFVMTIHGLRNLECPTDSSEKLFLSNFVRCKRAAVDLLFPNKRNQIREQIGKLLSLPNTKIVTVSNHSKYSISVFFPDVKTTDIEVLNPPIDFPITNEHDEKLKNGERYFLLIGVHRWEKNIPRALFALDALFSNGKLKDKKVVVTGALGIDKIKNRIVNKDRFTYHEYLSREELYRLMRNAFCFIYPSLNEGFGMPPIQSMFFRVPVIASSISSIPEACKDAALYCNPYSTTELENRILQITEDKELYRELQDKGTTRYRDYFVQQQAALNRLVKMIFGEE